MLFSSHCRDFSLNFLTHCFTIVHSSKVFTIRSATRIGKVYKKAMYREFTDSTFTKMKKRSPDMEHLGIMGPMIRAEEEDQIEIVLKNMATKNYSIQPHGVSYR